MIKQHTAAIERAIEMNRRYCRACGTRLVQESSKAIGICQACRRHCICCGRKTPNFGHFEVCFRCATRIEKTADMIARGDFPEPLASDDSPVPRADCSACGDPAERVWRGKPYCAECFAEVEGGGE